MTQEILYFIVALILGVALLDVINREPDLFP